jgi:hypothetical protein
VVDPTQANNGLEWATPAICFGDLDAPCGAFLGKPQVLRLRTSCFAQDDNVCGDHQKVCDVSGGWKPVDDFRSGWGVKDEISVAGGRVGSLFGEGESGDGAVDFFDSDAEDCAVGRDGEAERGDSLLHVLWDAGEVVVLALRSQSEASQFFGEFGVAEEKS